MNFHLPLGGEHWALSSQETEDDFLKKVSDRFWRKSRSALRVDGPPHADTTQEPAGSGDLPRPATG